MVTTPRHGNGYPARTDAGVLIDAICARRGVSLTQLAIEAGTDPSYLSRLRASHRQPSRRWLDRFVSCAQLTRDETIRAYEVFRFVPPGGIVLMPSPERCES